MNGVRMAPARAPLATLVARLAGRVTRTEPQRVFTTLARNRRLFRRWLPFAGGLLRGDLPRADTELLILRTAWNCAGWYVWVQHAGLAPARGLAPALVGAVPAWPDRPVWTPRQHDLLDAADQLHRDHVIADLTWARLAGERSDAELVELCLLVGHYEMLCLTTNSLGIEPEPAALAALTAPATAAAAALRARLVSARRP
ncbi:MAG TPA: carboxymuconolactone decarboxylase family protein [Actinophytocola sp.]|uniref:carboxymuconolactone decarboxylase family protein n=1 Tax=Actinophytocola sp. TaxID=1872138 RepID=UPI002DBA5C9C|nr:carboxymuconolactone decarboxylase family protein [Actinophytocola sp.]HEU5470984.1 carboxymuconolactone decarboxylase family protein [Actinophytocola sp.]